MVSLTHVAQNLKFRRARGALVQRLGQVGGKLLIADNANDGPGTWNVDFPLRGAHELIMHLLDFGVDQIIICVALYRLAGLGQSPSQKPLGALHRRGEGVVVRPHFDGRVLIIGKDLRRVFVRFVVEVME